MFRLSQLKKIEWSIPAGVVALNVIGIIAIWSSAGIREGGFVSFLMSYPVKQTIYMCIGVSVMLAVSCVNYLYLQKYAWWIYSGMILLLVYVLKWGDAFRGSRRWIDLYIVNLQPSELAKIGTAIALARYLMYKKNLTRLPQLIPPLGLALLPVGLIILEPDLGTSVLFGPMFLIVLFEAGASPKHLGAAILLIMVLVPIGYQFGLRDYQKARITGFMNPEEVPMNEGYHLIRSRIAIGTGGISGKGFGQSVEHYSRLVPERHNDFIFTVIGEEAGFLGAGTVILLYLMILIFAIKIIYTTREPFGRLVVVGILSMMVLQIFINIGMTIGMAPVTGLTLPFVSYGGSSLVTSYLAIGIVLSVGSWSIPSFSSRDHDYQDDIIKETPLRDRRLRTD